MTKSKFGAKIAFGDIERLQQALDNGIIDERDLVISNLRSLPSLFVIDDDRNIKKLRSYIDVFDTVEKANTWLNSIHTNVLDGQPIAILNSNKERYNLYLVKVYDDGSYGLNPVSDYAQIDKLEDHINDTNNPHKTTYEQVGLTPITDAEVKEIVNIVFS